MTTLNCEIDLPRYFRRARHQKNSRRVYNLDVERQAPEVIIELVSSDTKTEDLGNKREIYAGLGVKEYFLYDPHHAVMRPTLRGFRLEGGEYMPMVGTRLRSKVLGLELRLEKNQLRLYDPAADEYLPTHAESEAARRRAESRVGRDQSATKSHGQTCRRRSQSRAGIISSASR